MAWKVIDRKQVAPDQLGPGISDAVRDKIRTFFPKYPTRRAVLLPALHIVQESLGYVSLQAMMDVAALLEIPPSDVLDVVSFYTHFWTHPRGRRHIVLCRSLSCELMGAGKVRAAIEARLGIGDHETSADGAWSFMTEECLAGCDWAPCMLINEKMHKNVKPDDVEPILNDPECDKLDVPRSDLYDAPEHAGKT